MGTLLTELNYFLFSSKVLSMILEMADVETPNSRATSAKADFGAVALLPTLLKLA